MIAAMAAAVSAVSTLRLGSGAAGLSGNPALVEGVGPLGAFGLGTSAGACAHGRALTAYRIGPKCRQPQKKDYRPAPHVGIEAEAGRPRKLCRSCDTRSMAQHLTANNSDWV